MDREDLAGFPQQIEHHQHQHPCDKHGQAARQKQPHHVEREPARREEAGVDHASPNFGTSARMRRAVRVANHSSAPIGWPPGRWASTWYIHATIPLRTTSGTHRPKKGSIIPLVAACSAYWLTL